MFHPARRMALSAYAWNHAMRSVALTRDDTVTPVFHAYAYTFPPDCVRLVSVHPSNEVKAMCEYAIENITDEDMMIVSDSNQLYARYIFDNTDMTTASQGFRNVLAFVLARDLCQGLDKSASQYGLTEKEYRRTLMEAKSIEGQQKYPEVMSDGNWVKARFGRYTDKSVVES